MMLFLGPSWSVTSATGPPESWLGIAILHKAQGRKGGRANEREGRRNNCWSFPLLSLLIAPRVLPQVSSISWVGQRDDTLLTPLRHLRFRFTIDPHGHGLGTSVIFVQSLVIRIACMPRIDSSHNPRLSLSFWRVGRGKRAGRWK